MRFALICRLQIFYFCYSARPPINPNNASVPPPHPCRRVWITSVCIAVAFEPTANARMAAPSPDNAVIAATTLMLTKKRVFCPMLPELAVMEVSAHAHQRACHVTNEIVGREKAGGMQEAQYVLKILIVDRLGASASREVGKIVA